MIKKLYFVGWSSDYDKIMIEMINNNYKVHSILLPRILKFTFKLFNKIFNRSCARIITKFYVLIKMRGFDSSSILICKDSNFYGYIESVKSIDNKILIVRNTIKKDFYFKYKKYFKMIYSFDKNQCEKYGMKYLNQVIPMNSIEREKYLWKGEYKTCYFVGADKGRLSVIQKIMETLNEVGVQTKSIIVRDELTSKNNLKFTTKHELPYLTYFNESLDYGLLLDVNKKGQTGITMRVLESVYRNCKLITNNTSVRKLPFYNPKNIYIIDNLSNIDQKSLTEFINTPVELYETKLLTPFLVEGFINEIV